MTIVSDQLHLDTAALDAHWMPFTANRQFKSAPRMLARAEGMYYWTDDGKQILDGFAGLWCCNAGHARKPIVEAIQKHGEALFGQAIPAMGTPLYTDVRLYGEAGIPGVIYGAGPRTVLESNAKRADENLVLDDLRKATKVVARTLRDLLA